MRCPAVSRTGGAEDFGNGHESGLRTVLELPDGIPSHDTLSGVMGRIDKTAFTQALGAWVRDALPTLAGRQVALDGKNLRASVHQTAVHLMTAFATDARLVPGVASAPDKGSEISVIPGLLAQLELAGAIVTLDAMGCQKCVAQAIVKQKADYVLALEGNHPTLHDNVRL